MATPVSVSRAGKDVNAAVHGDDFTFTVDEAALKWWERLVNEWYERRCVRGRAWMTTTTSCRRYWEAHNDWKSKMTHCQWYWKRVERTARRSHDPLYGTDLPDVQFVRKEVCRGTSAPTEQSWKKASVSFVSFSWAEKQCIGLFRGVDTAVGGRALSEDLKYQSSRALSSCEVEYFVVVDAAS